MQRMESNPFIFGKPVTGKHFVGRRLQVQEVATDLTNATGDSLALIGGRRFGKTSFLVALRAILILQLRQAQSPQPFVFPVLVDLKSLEQRSRDGVFALMLHTFYEHFHSPLRRNEIGRTFDFNINQTRLAAFVQSGEESCSFLRFSDIVEEVLLRFRNTYGLLRPVFLIDEIEEIIDEDWAEHLFGNLRSLVYTDKLHRYLRFVIAGSSKIIEMREKGSPLLNMLKIVYLGVLADEYIEEIINIATNVPGYISDAVLEQSGGHPFIVQYLMHYWWESRSKGTRLSIPAIVTRFRAESHLSRWYEDIDKAGLIVYKVLLDAGAEIWLTRVEVKQMVKDERIRSRIEPALFNLCYHGFALHDGTWSRFRVTGELFKRWFIDEIWPALSPTNSLPFDGPSSGSSQIRPSAADFPE